MIHTVKGFGIVNRAETDVFLELSYHYFAESKNVRAKRESQKQLNQTNSHWTQE